MKEISLNILDIVQNSLSAGATVVDLTLVERDGALTLSVADDGCGMSPELLAQVTDPFCTTRTTRKVGLGFPLLAMATEQTGGTLTVDSTPGLGTTIVATFRTDHIDCPPLGDIAGTIALLIQGAPHVRLRYTHETPMGTFALDTDELRQILGENIPLDSPDVILWIAEYIAENRASLY